MIAWGIGNALAHYGISWALARLDSPPWLQRGWQAVTITYKARTVVQNERMGLHAIGSPGGCEWAR